MRLNGRAAIMTYLGIRGRATWFRYRSWGMPIHNGPRNRAWAKTEDLDRWSMQWVPRTVSSGRIEQYLAEHVGG